jgi:DNA-binding transcriptional ArsR family regulator
MQDAVEISDLETLKVISDPFRLEILNLLTHRGLTAREISTHMDVPQSKLYYHLNLLEKHGLIQVADTRVVQGIIEKTYRAVAMDFTISSSLLLGTAERMSETEALFVSIIDTARGKLIRSLRTRARALAQGAPEKSRSVVINSESMLLSHKKAEALTHKIKALFEEFQTEEDDTDDSSDLHEYVFQAAFFPMFYPELSQGEEELENDESKGTE